ncbi:MAG: helix-turn-helix domain-containing protein [Candidatus Moraniibacteriota bacterium]
MKEDFVRKKVESLTLGEKIKKLRSQYRMSLAEISKATKIQVKYLEALENGEYEKLPAEVYVRGFLKGYARHLGLDEEAFLKLYDKERNIQANLGREHVFDTRPRMPLTPSLVITARSLIVGIIVLLVAGTFFYLFHEFRSFVAEPTLVIFEPNNGVIIEGSSVTLKGKSDRGAQVMVNRQPVFVGTDGDFSEGLVLQSGLNTVTVTAVNRFEKEKSETLSFEARFDTPAPATMDEAQGKFMLVVTGKGKGAKLAIEADGVIVYSGELGGEKMQTVNAEKSVKISTENAQNTWVSFRGGESVALGDKPVSMKDVLYTSEGRQ